jgi:hydrogenase nickel incorporation protein HypA/HybF
MHELSLCQTIIGIINEHASTKEHHHVTKVSVEIGQLIAVDPAALRFSFDVVTKGTVAEKAVLDIIEIEGQAICDFCKKTVTLKRYYDPCQTCGHFALTVTQGEELRVTSMEVE